MKTTKDGTYFLLVVFLIMLAAVLVAFQIPTFKARILPLVISSATAILALIGLLLTLIKKPLAAKSEKAEATHADVKIIAFTAAWLGAFLLLIYFIGFPLAIFLFVTAYLKQHKKGWIKSIAWGLGMGAFIYVVFDFLLAVDLYRGVFYIPLYYYLP